MRRYFRLVSLLAVLALLVGCGSRRPAATHPTTTSEITALAVLRTSLFAGAHIGPYEATSTHAPQIQDLYALIQQLKPFPAGYSGSCALDRGVNYQLTFLAGSRAVLRVSVPIGGCWRVVLADGHTLQLTNFDFWTQFDAATGMLDSTVFDYTPAARPPYAPRPTLPASVWPHPPALHDTTSSGG